MRIRRSAIHAHLNMRILWSAKHAHPMRIGCAFFADRRVCKTCAFLDAHVLQTGGCASKYAHRIRISDAHLLSRKKLKKMRILVTRVINYREIN